ncbi:MAG: trypsin-like peptidase domain-containing protein [Candidatus Aerophobetes bacterium]|nr:trypsin-like peptidase domain-containing protein [Candidatus Aerophobetes bacterium]
MKLFSKVAILAAILCLVVLPSYAQGVKEAVVKIYTVYNRHNYYDPWQMYGQGMRSGSGCIIDGKRILTNAHVVGDQTFIQVKRAGQAKKYTASVKMVAHECDLAILGVKDDSFFSEVEPLKIGDLPRVRDGVAVYGFPQGGDELCITEGVVSRVEHHWYVHSQEYLLTCQIDASINPGSSGGPVVKDDKIVGVAFQAGSGENIGYMVSVPIIEHFMKDIEDDKYDGIPGIGISWQEMENPDIRKRYKMSEEQTGILVNKIYPGSPAEGMLKSEDIILSIDGKGIENDGTIEFRKGERTSFRYIVQNKYIGDIVELQILRNGELKNVPIELTKTPEAFRLVSNEQYDVPPVYYILGGLVFEPLTLNFLKTSWGASWYSDAPRNLVDYYLRGEPTENQKEVIILVKVLADEVNVGYHNRRWEVVSEVNGKKIKDMRDLVDAFESNKDKYHIIVNDKGYRIILDRAKVEESAERILKTYNISSKKFLDEL